MSIDLVGNFKKRALEVGFTEKRVDEIIKFLYEEIMARLEKIPAEYEKLKEEIITKSMEYGLDKKKAEMMVEPFLNRERVRMVLEEIMTATVVTKHGHTCAYKDFYEWLETYVKSYAEGIEKEAELKAIREEKRKKHEEEKQSLIAKIRLLEEKLRLSQS